MKPLGILTLIFLFTFCSHDLLANQNKSVIDAAGRTVSIPTKITRVICSGPGALRLLTYLGAQDLIVAVDDIEVKKNRFDARPYAIACPQFKHLPIFGGFRGFDHPELILALEKQPQVIFKTYPTTGHNPIKLQAKTGIPTIILEYGNLDTHRESFFQSLRIMGDIVGKKDRAEKIIAFFNTTINDLVSRTESIPEARKKSCFIGGIAYKGPHGFGSTEPGYPPFKFVHAANLAYDKSLMGKASRQVTISKEQLLTWDPEVLFLDLSTLQLQGKASGLWEIQNDPVLNSLSAVKQRRVYGVLPYNWYTKNYGSILADAYFIGKVLYPDRFEDVEPVAMADKIYQFLVGKPVFNEMNALFQGKIFKTVME